MEEATIVAHHNELEKVQCICECKEGLGVGMPLYARGNRVVGLSVILCSNSAILFMTRLSFSCVPASSLLGYCTFLKFSPFSCHLLQPELGPEMVFFQK